MMLILRSDWEEFQLFIEQAAYFLIRQPEVPGQHNRVGHGFGNTAAALRETKRRAAFGDKRSVAMAAINQAVTFEDFVRLEDGVLIRWQGSSHFTDAWKAVTDAKAAAGDLETDLIDDLSVDGDGTGGRKANAHTVIVH
jgi:hypothetical protein